MATAASTLKLPRRRLARIRCLEKCVGCFKDNGPLPAPLCYVPAEIELQTLRNVKLSVFSEPEYNESKKNAEVLCTAEAKILVSGEEYCNSYGQWAKIYQICMQKGSSEVKKVFPGDTWILLYAAHSTTDDLPTFSATSILKKDQRTLYDSWEEVVENYYSLHLGGKYTLPPADKDAVERLQTMPSNWTLDHDEELAQFLGAHVEIEDNLGSIKKYVESINVSSYCEDDGPENMTDNDPDTYWESDGNQGMHWIRLKMKKGTVVKKLFVTVDSADDNYLPNRILVMGGEVDNLKKLNECPVELSQVGTKDICVLQDQTEHHPIVEIRIKECKDDGIDTRIHNIKRKKKKVPTATLR